MSTELYDKHGIPIHEFDLIKMYHFTGSRRKKYYMHKLVVIRGGHFYGHHLNCEDFSGVKACFRLSQELLQNSEIVQGFHKDGTDFSDRVRKK